MLIKKGGEEKEEARREWREMMVKNVRVRYA